MKRGSLKIFLAFFLTVIFLASFSPRLLSADTISDIKKNIEEKNQQIEALNKEIKQLDEQIQVTNKESKNLQNTIKTLDASGKKLNKELELTQNKISNTTLAIQELGIEIKRNETSIGKNIDAIKNAIKTIHQTDDLSMVESVLTYENIATVWNDLEALEQFQAAAKASIDELRDLKAAAEKQRAETEQKKKTLLALTDELGDKKQIIENNKKEKESLLGATKNKESNYKKILEEKKRLSEAFEEELADYETQLKFIIDPKSYPSPGKGLLSWPLDNVFITQYFGNTAFAKTAAYKGKGHNGVDFRASRGTPVKAAKSGTVEGVGNTGAVSGCYSYGKWVLLRHNNGLSTLYAHLDLIKVGQGQSVNTGEIIGYSGSTGYSTGPHLHFGVYASQGVKIVALTKGQSINCTGAVLPVADLKAYLNPLAYL